MSTSDSDNAQDTLASKSPCVFWLSKTPSKKTAKILSAPPSPPISPPPPYNVSAIRVYTCFSTSRLKPYSIMMFFAKKSAPLSVPLSATPPPQRRERTTRITLTHYFCSTFQAWGRPRCLNLPKLDSYNRTLLLQLFPIVKCAFQLMQTLHTGVLNNLFVTTSNPD